MFSAKSFISFLSLNLQTPPKKAYFHIIFQWFLQKTCLTSNHNKDILSQSTDSFLLAHFMLECVVYFEEELHGMKNYLKHYIAELGTKDLVHMLS
jgi:hypothetical protein